LLKFELEFFSVIGSMLNHIAITILCSTLYIITTEGKRKSRCHKTSTLWNWDFLGRQPHL